MAKKKTYKELNENEILESLKNQGNVNYKVQIKCKNKKQKEFLHRLKDPNKIICFGIGSAGSGKSYISLAYALQALQDKDSLFDKIIFLIPPLQSCSKALNIGLLPGTVDEKTSAFREADQSTMEKILQQSGNIDYKTIVNDLTKNGQIEYKLVNFIRGVTYDNCILLINEAEGYDKDEMLLLLTRLGDNCKCVITGDEQQKSRLDICNGSGMIHAKNQLVELDEISITEFTKEDIVRNPIISKIIEKW